MKPNKKKSLSIGGAGAREARLRAVVDESKIISTQSYNMIMGLTVAYGLLVNLLICKFFGNAYAIINPILLLIGYLVLCFAGCFIARKSNNPVISFLGYNMVVIPMGLLVSTVVYIYGGIGSGIVMMAFADTLAITVLMIAGSMLFPQFFSKLGGVLFIGLIGIILCGVISLIFRTDGFLLSVISAGIFSLYIGYDFWRSQQFPKTVDNAIDCALDIYVDIINLFIRLLEILGRANNK
ncbi:MAG: Bax inhibitor-1 family protein [Lachnospiraceae bacterium]|nr:Bax inhibitor-1 family protein [Lachnospiraceae bacterium]